MKSALGLARAQDELARLRAGDPATLAQFEIAEGDTEEVERRLARAFDEIVKDRIKHLEAQIADYK